METEENKSFYPLLLQVIHVGRQTMVWTNALGAQQQINDPPFRIGETFCYLTPQNRYETSTLSSPK